MREVYISVDIEAAGPVPGPYSLLSIGACVVGKSERNYYVEIQPISDRIVQEAMEVIGKPLNSFKDGGQSPVKAMESFEQWLLRNSASSTPVFVGFNATFDWAFVNWYFHSFLGRNPFGIGGIDIKSFYMGMTGSSWRDTRSSLISKEFKGESAHTHNALDDAVEQAEMFNLMLRSAAKSQPQ